MRRRKFNMSLKSLFLGGAIAIVTIVVLTNMVRTIFLFRHSSVERANITREVEGRNKEIQKLEASLGRIESGEGLEIEARKWLNVRKPGEEVLIIVEDKKEEEVVFEEEKSFLQKVKNWLGM